MGDNSNNNNRGNTQTPSRGSRPVNKEAVRRPRPQSEQQRQHTQSGTGVQRPRAAASQSNQMKNATVHSGGRPPRPSQGVGRPSQPQKNQSRPPQQRQPQQRPPQQHQPQHLTNRKPPMTQKQRTKKKRKKIVLFVAEIFVLLILLVAFWGVMQAGKIQHITIEDDEVQINEEVKVNEETGAMKGYRNIAMFGVDSRDGELNKNTRTDTIMIASINMDTGEVKYVSVLRDTYLNLSNDKYGKCNSAYNSGGAKQAISMLNMNLDMNITDFVTIGFDGLIDVIDAVGGIEIDVQQNEIVHLNNYQISMVGKQTGTVNANGEPEYYAEPYVEYTPVEKAGLQKLNGLQATAYCRIRYVGNDFGRTQRQRTVVKKVAEKALTLNPATLNKIAEAVFPKVATSLELSEILELLSGITNYSLGENASFPFDGHLATGNIGKKGSCVVPTTLEDNVILLHEFFFGDEEYTPSETVIKCSQKVASDTSPYLN